MSVPETVPTSLIDAFGRKIDYVRLSVTDRCDLRCQYCLAEDVDFLPRSGVLSLDQMRLLCDGLVAHGVRTIRITGGEPLTRRGIGAFLRQVGSRVGQGLEALTLTTNGTRLQAHIEDLLAANIRRINVSIDSLKPDVFSRITRGGRLDQVLSSIAAARTAGLKVKLNTVVLRQDNLDEIPELIQFAHGHGMEISLIETMPVGPISGRESQYVALSEVTDALKTFWRLAPLTESSSGPARYVKIAETGGRLGLITPLSHNFCAACNRVRVDCSGKLFMCLGHDDHIDLKPALEADDPINALGAALCRALAAKPRAHDFRIGEGAPGIVPHRFMSLTGG